MNDKAPQEIWEGLSNAERTLLLTLCGHTGGCCVNDGEYRSGLRGLHRKGLACFRGGGRMPPRQPTPLGQQVAEYGRDHG